MQSVNLDNYSIINDYTGVPVTKAAINSPDVNAVYAHLETLANLAAIVHGVDTRAVLAICAFESSYGVGVTSTNNIMQTTSPNSYATAMGGLLGGCSVLAGDLSNYGGDYPVALSYYNCGEATSTGTDTCTGSGILGSAGGTTVSPYGAGATFLAFSGFSGVFQNGYGGYHPALNGPTNASVMATANTSISGSPYMCGCSTHFGGGGTTISQMAM
jgi:hypothetical protein